MTVILSLAGLKHVKLGKTQVGVISVDSKQVNKQHVHAACHCYLDLTNNACLFSVWLHASRSKGRRVVSSVMYILFNF